MNAILRMLELSFMGFTVTGRQGASRAQGERHVAKSTAKQKPAPPQSHPAEKSAGSCLGDLAARLPLQLSSRSTAHRQRVSPWLGREQIGPIGSTGNAP